jgi:hypothetical protein
MGKRLEDSIHKGKLNQIKFRRLAKNRIESPVFEQIGDGLLE